MTLRTAHSHLGHQVHGRGHETPTHPYSTVDQVLIQRMEANSMDALNTEGQVSWRIPTSPSTPNSFTQFSVLSRTEPSTSNLRRRYVKEGEISFWVHLGLGWLDLLDYSGNKKRVELRVEKIKARPETMLPLRITVPAFILHNIVSRGEFMLISSQQSDECEPRIIHDGEDFHRFIRSLKSHPATV